MQRAHNECGLALAALQPMMLGTSTNPRNLPPPRLPGPCYWLVASGTPVGWRGGFLALGLVRGAVPHYCLGGCSALVVCARPSRPVRRGWGRCWVYCLPRFPLPAPLFLRCVWWAVLSGCPLSSLAGTPFHAFCAFRGLRLVALLVFPLCPLCVCVRSRSRGVRAPPPLSGLVWRAYLVPSLCWAMLGRSTRSVPLRVSCLGPVVRSACFGGGAAGPVSSYLDWGCALPVGWVRAWETSPTPPRALLRAGLACWLGAL